MKQVLAGPAVAASPFISTDDTLFTARANYERRISVAIRDVTPEWFQKFYRISVESLPENNPCGVDAGYQRARKLAQSVKLGGGEDHDLKKLAEFFTDAARMQGGCEVLRRLLCDLTTHRAGEFTRCFKELTWIEDLSAAEMRGRTLLQAESAMDRLAMRASIDPTRPVFHPHPRGGWHNDPHGLFFDDKGALHIFAQSNPFGGTHWGNMHWAHIALQPDGSITDLPIALEPQLKEGEQHCFSGCGAVVADPLHPGKEVRAIFYSSIGPDFPYKDGAVQKMAICRDPNFETWEPKRQVVLTEAAHTGQSGKIYGEPPMKIFSWRDPTVFKACGSHFMILCGDTKPFEPGGAFLVIYQAQNEQLSGWKYLGLTFPPFNQTPYIGRPDIIECPNVQKIGEKYVVSFGAQYIDGRPEKNQFFIGQFEANGRFVWDERDPQASGLLDQGRCTYSWTSTLHPDGRAVYMGWIKGFPKERGDWNDLNKGDRGWNGSMTLAQERFFHADGSLGVRPLDTYTRLRGVPHSFDAQVIRAGETKLLGCAAGDCLELRLKLELGAASKAGVRLMKAGTPAEAVEISYDGEQVHVGDESFAFKTPNDEALDLHVFLDKCVIEVFVNERKSMAKIIAPGERGIVLFSDGGRTLMSNIQAWEMGSAYRSPRYPT